MGLHGQAGHPERLLVHLLLQVIHPGQVAVVQAAFSPGTERVEWARELVREHEEHQREGRGAFTFRGAMIDMPTVRQAQNVLEVAARSSS